MIIIDVRVKIILAVKSVWAFDRMIAKLMIKNDEN